MAHKSKGKKAEQIFTAYWSPQVPELPQKSLPQVCKYTLN